MAFPRLHGRGEKGSPVRAIAPLRPLAAAVLVLLVPAGLAAAASPKGDPLAGLAAVSPDLEALYVDLHRTPELSRQEEKTAAKMGRACGRSGSR